MSKDEHYGYLGMRRRGFLFIGLWTLAVLLLAVSCRPILRYDGELLELRRMKANVRWHSIELIKDESSNPSARLLAIAERSDHISRIQALLILADLPWERGVREKILGLAQKSQDSLVRAAAVRALRRVKSFPHAVNVVLRERVKDRAWQVRRMALDSLMFFPLSKQRRLSLCRKLLQDPHPAVRWNAISCWRRVSMGSERGAKALVSLLADPSARVRRQAAQSLGWWGETSLPALRDALSHPKEVVRCLAMTAMGDFRNHFSTIIPLLHQALKTGTGLIPSCAVRALGSIASHTKLVVPALIDALKHPQRSVAFDGISSLQKMGKLASPSIPVMLQLAQNTKKNLFLRYAAVNAIRHLVTQKKSNVWKAATAIHHSLYKRVKESLFSDDSALIDSSLQVSMSRIWTIGVPGRAYSYQIEKEYIPVLRACHMNLAQQSQKSFWVELFLERHGRVVLPLVFKLDRKTPVFSSCINQSVWAWKFPRLRTSRYGYLQFQIQFSAPEPDDLELGPVGGSSSGSGQMK